MNSQVGIWLCPGQTMGTQVGEQLWTGAQVNPRQVGPPAQVWIPGQIEGPPQVICGLQV